jgi:hypothetical protein
MFTSMSTLLYIQLAIDLNIPLDESHDDPAIPYEKGVKKEKERIVPGSFFSRGL